MTYVNQVGIRLLSRDGSCGHIVKNFILIGDIHKSIYFLSWKENGSQLTLLAKDFGSLNCVSTEFLIDGSTLSLMVYDDQKNVQVNMSFCMLLLIVYPMV